MPLPEGVAQPPVPGPGIAEDLGEIPPSAPAVDGAGVQTEAVDGAPVDGAPVDGAPVEGAPVDGPLDDHRALEPGPRSGVRSAWAGWRRPLLVGASATVVLRLVTEWIGLVSQYGVNFPHRVARQPDLLVQVWNHWDAGYYTAIAAYGYPGHRVGPGQVAHSIAFAPLYPAGIAVVHAVTRLGYVASAELLSGLCLVVALAALYRLCVVDSGGAPGPGGGRGHRGLAHGVLFLAPTPRPWPWPPGCWPSWPPGGDGG